MVGKWFPRGRRPIDKKRHSSRGIAARKAVRPSFEFLEIRLTPASVSLVSNDLEITASTSASENITVTRAIAGYARHRHDRHDRPWERHNRLDSD